MTTKFGIEDKFNSYAILCTMFGPKVLIQMTLKVAELREAGFETTVVIKELAKEMGIPRHTARRLVGYVDEELQVIKRRMGLPPAISAESLRDECIKIRRSTSVERN